MKFSPYWDIRGMRDATIAMKMLFNENYKKNIRFRDLRFDLYFRRNAFEDLEVKKIRTQYELIEKSLLTESNRAFQQAEENGEFDEKVYFLSPSHLGDFQSATINSKNFFIFKIYPKHLVTSIYTGGLRHVKTIQWKNPDEMESSSISHR